MTTFESAPRRQSPWSEILMTLIGGTVLIALVIGVVTLLSRTPIIEVQTLGVSPAQTDDYNAEILPSAKRDRVYSHLITVHRPFKGYEYVAAYPKDAVTIATSGGEVYVRVYTDDPSTARVEKFLK